MEKGLSNNLGRRSVRGSEQERKQQRSLPQTSFGHGQHDCASDHKPRTPQMDAAQEARRNLPTRRLGETSPLQGMQCFAAWHIDQRTRRCQIFSGSAQRVASSWSSSSTVKDRWHIGCVEGGKIQLLRMHTHNILARWHVQERVRATRGAATVLVALWTVSEDARQLEVCSAELGRALENHEVFGLLQKWRPLREKLHAKPSQGEKHPRRTAAFTDTLGWLDDEELHQLYPVGISAWKQQRDDHHRHFPTLHHQFPHTHVLKCWRALSLSAASPLRQR